MKTRGAHVWIALFSAAAVVLVAVVDIGRTSPGPLTAVHQREPDLLGKSGCNDCHGGFLSNMTDSCLECHADIETQIDSNDGLHGVVGRTKAMQCALCHSEHHGESFAIVNKSSFVQAGIPRPGEFDHRLIGFEIAGRHIEIGCAECHLNANATVLPKGEKRFGGLDQDCASCHEDPHKGQMAVACAACHGQNKWDRLYSLGHEKNLPLIGGHADVSCRKCHAETTSHSLEALGDRARRPTARTCRDCHESPHSPSFVAGVAGLAAMAPDASCVTCHEADHETFRDERLAITPEQHARSGFPLDVPHDQVACKNCHAPDARDFAARYPGRGADECSPCHADPHGGQFKQGPFSQGDCLACHDRHHFEPHDFTVAKHAQSSLPLTGSHIETDCNACHEKTAEDRPRTFRGTPGRCEQCHADAHDGFFEPFHVELAAVTSGECARCHGTQTFSKVAPADFDHARWTDFDVRGAHAQSGCESCHPAAEHPDASGRTFGRVTERFGAFEGCITCHDDPHAGTFDAADLPSDVEGLTDCARCHTETSFRTFPHGFDHGRWTDFTLAGAHAKANCSACHAPLRKPDALGRTWAPANGPNCADCHEDPHARQFEVDGETSCERCHTDRTSSFLAFDHERDSRFSLGEQHASLACSACHLPTVQDGAAVIRYRPLGTQCVDCHGAQEDIRLRKTARKK